MKFDAGELGNPDYQIDALPRDHHRAALRVQLNRKEAEALIKWHRPEIAAFPIQEVPDLADADSFLDALIEAVHAWAATFPVWAGG